MTPVFAGLCTLLLAVCPASTQTNDTIRLAGGNATSGRVEVLFNGTWGTVCDNSWSVEDAIVVCRQLGRLTTDVQAYSEARFGPGDALFPILLDGVQCNGTENSLLDCPAKPVGTHNCLHSEDAGVSCGDIIRIAGGNVTSGRVEVLINGTWGTVCDDRWSDEEAIVVCRQLGLPTMNVEAYTGAYFGPGDASLPILLNDVQCSGTENSLLDCPAQPVGSHNCRHNEDAGVSCTGKISKRDFGSNWISHIQRSTFK